MVVFVQQVERARQNGPDPARDASLSNTSLISLP